MQNFIFFSTYNISIIISTIFLEFVRHWFVVKNNIIRRADKTLSYITHWVRSTPVRERHLIIFRKRQLQQHVLKRLKTSKLQNVAIRTDDKTEKKTTGII